MTVDKGILIQNIYYMLSYAFHILKQEDYRKVAVEHFDKVHNLFAAILAKGISRQLKQGLYREYIPMHDNLSVMRGKLNINDTIHQQIQRSQKLACEFDEFSEDNLYNQILKLTADRLIHSPDVERKYQQALKKVMVFFHHVKLIPPDQIQWNLLAYQQGNRNYELLLNLCYLVLNDMLQTTEDGIYRLVSFSEEHMERLYEKFILEYYKQHYPNYTPSARRISWNLTQTPDKKMMAFLPNMYTDITLQNNGITLIIDAKYYGKSLIQNYDKVALRSAHLYQIFAYVKNLDTANSGNVAGLLLYAKTEEDIFPDGEPFVIGGNAIGAKMLDLNQEFHQIARQLDLIATTYFGELLDK